MQDKDAPNPADQYPGEWTAIANGRVIAHGYSFREVAEQACDAANDVILKRAADPNAPLWKPDPELDEKLTIPLPPVRSLLSHADVEPRRAAPPPPPLR